MNIVMKYKSLESVIDIFAIKTGKIYKSKSSKKCFRANKLFTTLYHFLMIGPIQLFWVFLFLSLPGDNIILNLFLTIVIYLFIEIILIAFVPIEEVNCWERGLKYP